MTDKQIIIDGVDVKDCKRRIGKDNFCRYYKRPCAENNYNCIWKKYLRKEQECETLASQLDFEVQKKECLEQECEETKQYAQDVYDFWQSLTESFNILQDEKTKLEQECDQLKQAIARVKELIQKEINDCEHRDDCTSCEYNCCIRQAMQICNEVYDG